MLQVIFEAPIVRGLGGLKRLVLLAPLGQRVPGLGRVSSTPKHAHIEPTRSSSKAPRIPFLQSPYKVGEPRGARGGSGWRKAGSWHAWQAG